MSIEAREGSRLEASEPESKPRDFQGKRLLILAGAGQHCKLVDAAKKLGVYTIVCDYLEPSIESPAKLLADECWNISTLDVDAIVAKCKDVQVDGVMSGWNDVAQMPYFEICERLNLPCYGTRNQFETLTDKRLFKQFCKDNNVNVIDEYTQEDVVAGRVEFPVFIKPADGCGSKGQSICSCQKEVQEAIAHAKDYSRSGELLFEQYVPDTNSFQVTYFFIDGEPFLIRTADGYKGTREVNLDRVALCSVSPSSFTEEYLERADEAVVEMLKKLGIVDGPVMIQGFYDNGVFRFYDPGLRFPGTDFEVVYKSLFGTDFMEAMVVYAITGELPEIKIQPDSFNLNGKVVAVLFPTLNVGEIGSVKGLRELHERPEVHAVRQWHCEGQAITEDQCNTSKLRLAEIDVLADSLPELKAIVNDILENLAVDDVESRPMLTRAFDSERIR